MEKINKLYKEVFDPNGEVKCCGRYKCMDLIEACLLLNLVRKNTSLLAARMNLG